MTCTSSCVNVCVNVYVTYCNRTHAQVRTVFWHGNLTLIKGLECKKRKNSCYVHNWQILSPEDKHSYIYASWANSSGFICILLPVSYWWSWLYENKIAFLYMNILYAPGKYIQSLLSFGTKLCTMAPVYHIHLTIMTMHQVLLLVERWCFKLNVGDRAADCPMLWNINNNYIQHMV